MPWRSGLDIEIYWTNGRTKGIAQKAKAISTAGPSHRREANSGGQAETQVANDF